MQNNFVSFYHFLSIQKVTQQKTKKSNNKSNHNSNKKLALNINLLPSQASKTLNYSKPPQMVSSSSLLTTKAIANSSSSAISSSTGIIQESRKCPCIQPQRQATSLGFKESFAADKMEIDKGVFSSRSNNAIFGDVVAQMAQNDNLDMCRGETNRIAGLGQHIGEVGGRREK